MKVHKKEMGKAEEKTRRTRGNEMEYIAPFFLEQDPFLIKRLSNARDVIQEEYSVIYVNYLDIIPLPLFTFRP